MAEVWDVAPPPTQLDRIEAKLDQLLAKKKPKARASKKVLYPFWFESIWAAYPKRAGSNPKAKAWSAINARLKAMSGNDGRYVAHEYMLLGTIKYAKFCDATGKTGTEYVMQAATFFGPDKHYENDWTIPKKKPSEDPDKQYHKTFNPDDEVVIPEGVNPYENM